MKINIVSRRYQLLAVSLALVSLVAPPSGLTKQVSGSQSHLMKAKIERNIALADELMLKAKPADAEQLYRQVLSRNPQEIAAVVGLGMALGRQFKLDAAEEQFDEALALDPRNALAHSGKAMVLVNRLQSSSMTVRKNRESTLKQAEEESRTALSIDPGLPEAHYYLGTVLKEQNKLDEAGGEFTEATKLDPQYSDAFAGIGLTKLTQGSLAEAAENFKKAIALNSGNSTAHYGLGTTYLKQGQVDEALKELNTALYQYPNSAPTHISRGEAFETQGNTVAAVKEYQAAIAIKAENAAPYLHIADIREGRGDIEHSIAELRSGLELMPNNPELRQRIGDESLRLDKLDDAIAEYNNVLSVTPNFAPALKGLTRAYYLKAEKEGAGAFLASNDYEQADRMIEKAIALNPNDMELRLAQAKLQSLSGKEVDLSGIGAPKNDGERIAYAEALLAQNKFQEASDQMSTVIANAPDAKQAFAVGDLAFMIKDLDSAEAAYKKASTFAGSDERAKRGLSQVSKAREAVAQDLRLADDLARKGQLASAIDKYHEAIYGNPRLAEARLNLARTVEKLRTPTESDLREAAVEYRAYVALKTDLPTKDKDKWLKRADTIDTKARKIAERTNRSPH